MKAASRYFLLVSQWLIIVGFWFWNHVNQPMGNALTGDPANRLLAYGRLAGLLAAFGILLQLILAGRVKWVEQVFGLDRLLRLHQVIGFSLLVFLIAHPILVTAGHALMADVSRADQLRDFFAHWDSVLAATVGLALMIAATAVSVAIIRRRMPFEAWYVTHLTFYLAILLAFGHQIAVGGDFADHPGFTAYWYALYAFTFGNLLYYRLFRPFWMFHRHRFQVVGLQAESSDVTSVFIEGRNLQAFPIEAGQFMLVRFWAPGLRWQVHPFSLSGPPDGTRIRLTIKALGDFTRRIPEIKPGTPVIIDGPHGLFTPRRSQLNKVLLIAGGIGITPIRSIADTLVASGKDVTLIYGNRTLASSVFLNELTTLAAQAPDRFRIFNILSHDPGSAGEKGYVDRDCLTRLASDIRDREVYLCGPPGMMKKLRGILMTLGVPATRIYDERFAL